MTRFPDSYIVLDTETTGLSGSDRVIELAAVKVINRHCVSKYQQLFDPGRPIPARITEITGITGDMVRGQPAVAKLLPDFYRECGGLPVVGHNIAFDFRMLQNESARARQPFTLLRGPDTCLLARQLLPGLPSYSLSFLTEQLQLRMKPCHRALADVYATALLFEHLRRVAEEEQAP